ncbi:unnamed protein product [Aphanomyces euteiches]
MSKHNSKRLKNISELSLIKLNLCQGVQNATKKDLTLWTGRMFKNEMMSRKKYWILWMSFMNAEVATSYIGWGQSIAQLKQK